MSGMQTLLIPGGSVLPSGISGLRYWGQPEPAYINSGSPSDTDPVTHWYSREGNLYDFTQSTASKKPQWNAADANFNNRPTLTFDGGDLLRYAGSMTTATSGSAWLVCRPTIVGATSHPFSSSDEATTTHVLTPFRFNPTDVLSVYQVDGGAGDTVLGDTSLVVNTPYIFRNVSNGTAWALGVNGSDETESVGAGSNSGDWFGDTSDRDNLIIGALKYTSELAFFTGQIAEIILFDRELSTMEIALVERYLSARYAIALAA